MNKSQFFIISFLLHVVLLLLLNIPVKNNFSDPKKDLVEVTFNDSDTKELVDQDYKNKIKPHHSQVLGKQNQEVKKQTVVKHKDILLKDLMPKHDFTYKDQNGDVASNNSEQSSQAVDNSPYGKYKNIKEGGQTALNSDEFKYFSYYQRIREQLASHWYSDIRGRLERLQQAGQLRRFEKTTRTLVTLDDKGNLIKVQIVSASGLEDLDSSSLQAFKSANPFPNPPKDLISKEGIVVIAWDFILEIN